MARRFPFGDRNVQDDLRTTLMESHLLIQKTVLSAMVIFFKRGKAQGIPFYTPHFIATEYQIHHLITKESNTSSVFM